MHFLYFQRPVENPLQFVIRNVDIQIIEHLPKKSRPVITHVFVGDFAARYTCEA